jgi:hypothetical protein
MFNPRVYTTHSFFEMNDAVESLAFSHLNSRLVISSHSGLVKTYGVHSRSTCYHIPR